MGTTRRFECWSLFGAQRVDFICYYIWFNGECDNFHDTAHFVLFHKMLMKCKNSADNDTILRGLCTRTHAKIWLCFRCVSWNIVSVVLIKNDILCRCTTHRETAFKMCVCLKRDFFFTKSNETIWKNNSEKANKKLETKAQPIPSVFSSTLLLSSPQIL